MKNSICDYCSKTYCSYEPHSEECQSSRIICEFCGFGNACKDDVLYKYNWWEGGIDFEKIRIQYCPVCGKELPDE